MSANAPAGKANSTMGTVLTVCTKATIIGFAFREVIIQLAPTLCIQVPILDANVASHTARNNLLRSGFHADGGWVIKLMCAPSTEAWWSYQTRTRANFKNCHKKRVSPSRKFWHVIYYDCLVAIMVIIRFTISLNVITKPDSSIASTMSFGKRRTL